MITKTASLVTVYENKIDFMLELGTLVPVLEYLLQKWTTPNYVIRMFLLSLLPYVTLAVRRCKVHQILHQAVCYKPDHFFITKILKLSIIDIDLKWRMDVFTIVWCYKTRHKLSTWYVQ